MEIIEISSEEYSALIGEDNLVFMTSAFLEHNRGKVDALHYLLGVDAKKRIALAIGEKDGEWKAPFSAPFGNLMVLQPDLPVDTAWDFVNALNAFVKEKGGKSIDLYLPADIYTGPMNTKVLNALLGNGYALEYLDINYSFDLKNIQLESYQNTLHRSAKRNLRLAREVGLDLVHCDSREQKEEAYEIIRINRESRGFPLRMTCKQLMDTLSIVDHNVYLVKYQSQTIASAVVYHLNSSCAQVIYWGEIPGVSHLRSICYLAFCLISIYKEAGYRILDIGISTEYGIPNYGLCSFKESIGCIVSNKYRLKATL